MNDLRHWQLGGLANPKSLVALERPDVDALGWFRPHRTWIQDGYLHWEPPREYETTGVTVGAGMLTRFASLHRRPDETVAAYAGKWGVLGLCRCAEQHLEDMWAHNWEDSARNAHLVPCSEPIDLWRQVSEEAYAILNIAASLRRNQPASEDDLYGLARFYAHQGPWRHVAADDPFAGEPPPDMPTDIDTQAMFLGGAINKWLVAAGVRPHVIWRPSTARTFLTQPGLLAALGIQLLEATTGAPSPIRCSHCKKSYEPKRRPRLDQNNFCPRCRNERVPARLNARKHRSETSRGGTR